MGLSFPQRSGPSNVMLDLPLGQRLSKLSAAALTKESSAPVSTGMADEGFQEDLELEGVEHGGAGAEDMDDATAVSTHSLPLLCPSPAWLQCWASWENAELGSAHPAAILCCRAEQALLCPWMLCARQALANKKKA
jgi:hypothetical protein